MHPIEAALYARVSTDQQTRGQTIVSQVAALRERVAVDGLVLDPEHVFVDDGVSGTSLLRPALERLRDAVAMGGLDRLYVQSPDRLARRYAYQVLLVEEFHRAGTEIVFLNRPIGVSPEDDLLLQLQGMIAEYERAKILERSRRGRRHAAQMGAVSALGRAPFGYRYVPKSEGGGIARIEIVPEQAPYVRLMFAWVGLDRLSLREVCRRLQDAGVLTATGLVDWDPTSIARMVRNPAYRGQASSGGCTAFRHRPSPPCAPAGARACREARAVSPRRRSNGSPFRSRRSLIPGSSRLPKPSSMRIAAASVTDATGAGCCRDSPCVVAVAMPTMARRRVEHRASPTATIGARARMAKPLAVRPFATTAQFG